MIIGIGFGYCDCKTVPEMYRPDCRQHAYMFTPDWVILTNRRGEIGEVDSAPTFREFDIWETPTPMHEIMDEFGVPTP